LAKLPSLMIIGTDTGVGKTIVTALLVKKYNNEGIKTVPFKPVASGSVKNDSSYFWPDILFLSKSTDSSQDEIYLYKFHKPLCPHLASKDENVNVELSLIRQKYDLLKQKNDTVIVEAVGGAMVPLNEKKETLLDLASILNLPVIIVTRPGLGTLNHTLLTVNACKDAGIEIAGIVVNRFPEVADEATRTNPAELEKLTGLPVIAIIPETDVSVEDLNCQGLNALLKRLDLSKLVIKKADHNKAVEADEKYVWHPFTPMQEYLEEQPHPLMIVRGNGSYLEDSDGKRYLDGVSSLWVNIHGHRKKELDVALKSQIDKIAHSTLLGLSNEPSALLAKELVDITPEGLEKVFYSDSGSTAVEIALKVAYQYWQQKGLTRKKEFVSFVNAYHGDTIGSVSVGGMDLFHSKFKPLLFKAKFVSAAYCYRCPVNESVVGSRESRLDELTENNLENQAPGTKHQTQVNWPDCNLACLNELEDKLARDNNEIAAVIVEPKVQGAAGILTQPPGYLKRIEELCKKYSVLLIADEVATGFGRTGKMFACEHENVKPDIMALAKGITGGYLPLAATLFTEEIYNTFLGAPQELRTFFHGHTYTGNPLACAVALANLELVNKDGFMSEVECKAALFADLLKQLSNHDHVGDIRQTGLMAGIELVKDKGSREQFSEELRVGRQVILKARERGVIIRPLSDVIVLMPPLSISEEELKKLVSVASLAISEVTNNG
jgi:adenosylmethionine-8-amino-7-oxononanoate aminotransferase